LAIICLVQRRRNQAKPIVDAIDKSQYKVEITPAVDRYKRANGVLEIQFAKIEKIKNENFT